MAKKGAKKMNYEANEAFLQYEEEIVNHPTYAGMPDLRHDNGTIQWETPSNRNSGAFQFSHDKRYQWWVEKAAEIGISTSEAKWISKVAKTIHPTKLHPCKICGRVMDTRYCYLSSNFMKRVQKLPFYDNSVEMDELTHILDFVTSLVDTYGDIAYEALPKLLKCKQVKDIPSLPHDISLWTSWIEQSYIPKEPSMLSPGAMANPPDRLDGFHTFNRCCRPTADKGRSKENLASYSTDRRAFENWSDGNWITANKLMGYINSNPAMKKELCANEGDGGQHPRPCSADHIGPISLGFCHRPEFQLLCKPCNSAKNNRFYYSDVQHLIEVEKSGETIATWYADSIWQKCKGKVTDKETALRLYRIMRDNRNIAMMLLADFIDRDEFLFLFTLLNLEYADYDYDIIPGTTRINHQIVTVDFSQKASTLRYVNIQKTRKIRVAFSSLSEYAKKENRNGYTYTNAEIEALKKQAFTILSNINSNMKKLNAALIVALSDEDRVDAEIEAFLSTVDYAALKNTQEFIHVKKILKQIMELVAQELSSNWNNPRYSRETADE
ncbi:MAG: Alw26I/Eco31I/Esp3I family type II restriction endonuclease [Ruminococcus albus]|nr:Alw26I/Eco31I/Esp3I family type II restriction endonuclease [Ruminococcus albus]